MRERSRKYVESTFDNQSPKPERSNTKTNHHHHHHRHHHNNNNNKHIENVCLDMDLCASVRACVRSQVYWVYIQFGGCACFATFYNQLFQRHIKNKESSDCRARFFFSLSIFSVFLSSLVRRNELLEREMLVLVGYCFSFIFVCRLPRGLILVRRRFAFASMHNLAIWISSAARVGIAHQMSTSLLFIFITEKTKGEKFRRKKSKSLIWSPFTLMIHEEIMINKQFYIKWNFLIYKICRFNLHIERREREKDVN